MKPYALSGRIYWLVDGVARSRLVDETWTISDVTGEVERLSKIFKTVWADCVYSAVEGREVKDGIW
jgi:hypothetical protein